MIFEYANLSRDTFVLSSRFVMYCARDKRSTSEFTVNKDAPSKQNDKTVETKATKREGGYEKYNSRSRGTWLLSRCPRPPFCASPHKSEIRIKKARHIINVRRSRKMRSVRRHRHPVYTCRFIKDMHTSTHICVFT